MNIISLGAGVQSSTMALMAAHGEITPMPDAAIFADTQWEPPRVYEWLEWLQEQLPYEVYRVSAGNLRDDTISGVNTTGGSYSAIPWHIRLPDGSLTMGQRQCSREYKLLPIYRKVKDLLDPLPAGKVNLWLGISIDEISRAKDSRVGYIQHRWPLIEKTMRRSDCMRWMQKNSYPEPPRSACIACPFRSKADWREIRANSLLWADAVEVDELIRHRSDKGEQFAHSSGTPLVDVDFSTDEDRGQLSLFNSECEGMCGV